MASLCDPGRLEDEKGPEPFNPGLSEFCWICERDDEMFEHRSQMVLPYKLDLAQRYYLSKVTQAMKQAQVKSSCFGDPRLSLSPSSTLPFRK